MSSKCLSKLLKDKRFLESDWYLDIHEQSLESWLNRMTFWSSHDMDMFVLVYKSLGLGQGFPILALLTFWAGEVFVGGGGGWSAL